MPKKYRRVKARGGNRGRFRYFSSLARRAIMRIIVEQMIITKCGFPLGFSTGK